MAPIYKLKSWVPSLFDEFGVPLNKNKHRFPQELYGLYLNERALDYLLECPYFNSKSFHTHLPHSCWYENRWSNLASNKNQNPNPKDISLLTKNIHKLTKKEWIHLSQMKCKEIVDILLQHPDKINWYWLSANEYAMPLLKTNPEHICWEMLSANPHVNAIEMLADNVDKICWENLSTNHSLEAINLLRKYPHKIYWNKLAYNLEPTAMELFQKYPHFIPYAPMIYANPNIFEYDYDKMQNTHVELKQHLLETMLHPNNFAKFQDWGLI